MPDAHVDWLIKHTFPCPKLGTTATPARVSPEMCQANRANALFGSTCAACDKDGMWEVYQAGDIPAPPRATEKPQAKETKEVSTMPTGYKTCPNCSAVVGTKAPLCDCGYDFKAKVTTAQNEAEKASSGDVATSQDQPLPAGVYDVQDYRERHEVAPEAVAENATTEPEKKKPILDNKGQNGMRGRKVVQLHYDAEDPRYLRLEATARRYMVEPSKIVHWVLEGVPFEMVEPEKAEA